MLDLFFKSKIRSNLLKLFFSNPEREFYTRELSRMIGTSAGNIQKELQKLEKHEILKSQKKANAKFYSLNKSHPLIGELQKIITKTIGIEAEFKRELKNLKGLKFAFLFGSYVKNELKADSDIDLFVIGGVSEDDLIRKIKKVESKIQREINFHIAKPAEFLDSLKSKYFYKEITGNYILLTDNEDEFGQFIKGAQGEGEA